MKKVLLLSESLLKNIPKKMSYYLTQSNCLKTLLKPLQDSTKTISFFDCIHLVVQNTALKKWVQFEISDQQGCYSSHIKIINQEEAMSLYLQNPKEIKEKPSLSLLYLTIYQIIQKEIEGNKRLPVKLKNFWQNKDIYSDSIVRNISLCQELSKMCLQYIQTRLHLIRGWVKGDIFSSSENKNLRDREEIFAWLFQQFHQNSLNIEYFLDLISTKSINNNPQINQKKPLFILGSLFLTPKTFDFFIQLSKQQNIHYLLWSPTNHYWGEDLISQDQPLQTLSQLSNLHRRAQNYILDIQNQIPFYEDSYFSQIIDKKNYLEWCQSLIQKPDLKTQPPKQDDSFLFIECPNPTSEVEVLFDQALNFLNQTTKKNPQIHILCPQLEDYAPIIEKIFKEQPYNQQGQILNYQIQGLNLKAYSSWLNLLELILEFIITPPDINQLIYFCSHSLFNSESNIRSEDLQTILKNVQLKPLSNKSKVPHVFIETDNPFHKVQNEEGQKALSQINCLLKDIHYLNQNKFHLSQWQGLLPQLTNHYLQKNDHEETTLAYSKWFLNLAELERTSSVINSKDKFQFSQLFPFLKKSITSMSYTRGHGGLSSITFSNPRNLRMMPCDMTYFLGFQENNFPLDVQPPQLDISSIGFHPLDADQKDVDAYNLIEIISTTKTKLVFSYSKKSIEGLTLNPSPFLKSLEVIHSSFEKNEFCVLQQPINTLDKSYFESSNITHTHLTQKKETYLALHRHYKKNEDRIHNIDSAKIKNHWNIHELILAFQNPAKSFFKLSQKIQIKENKPFRPIKETLDPSALHLFKLRYDLFNIHLKKISIDKTYIEKLVESKLSSLGLFTNIHLQEICSDLERKKEIWNQHLNLGQQQKNIFFGKSQPTMPLSGNKETQFFPDILFSLTSKEKVSFDGYFENIYLKGVPKYCSKKEKLPLYLIEAYVNFLFFNHQQKPCIENPYRNVYFWLDKEESLLKVNLEIDNLESQQALEAIIEIASCSLQEPHPYYAPALFKLIQLEDNKKRMTYNAQDLKSINNYCPYTNIFLKQSHPLIDIDSAIKYSQKIFYPLLKAYKNAEKIL